MRTKIFLKKFISISVAVVSTVTLAGCFDLGGYENEADYYDSFGDVGLIYQNPSVVEKNIEQKDYSIQDYFYNKATGEDFAYGDPKDEESDEGKDIPQLPYIYMAIPAESHLNVESFALYFNATQTCSLEVFIYVVDSLPDITNVRIWGDPEYQPETDGDGNPKYKQKVDENGELMFDADGNPIYEQQVDADGKPMFDEVGNPIYEQIYVKLDYSDPADDLIVAKSSVHVKNGEWVSLLVDNWNSESGVQIEDGQYLLLRFVNNSGAYMGENPTVAFRVTNLLIRAFPVSDS